MSLSNIPLTMSQPNNKPSNIALKWIAGILATVISGVAVFWLTEGLGSRPQASSSNVTESPEAQPSQPSQPVQPNANEVAPHTKTLNDLEKGVLFELESCAQEDDTLTCDIQLTDQRDNRELTVYVNNKHAKSRVIDVNAAQMVPHHIYFGDRESRGYVTQPLVQGIPLKASLVFDEIQIQENTVSLVEIGVYTQDDKFFSAQFMDVPVTR